MAKKKKDQEPLLDEYGNEKEKAGSKIITTLIVIALILIWLGVFALLIKLDVGGFGSSVLRPILKDVPLINRVLPTLPDDEIVKEEELPYKNISEATDLINNLQSEITSLKKEAKQKDTVLADKDKEIERLKVFEENQLEYEKKLKDFETDVVFNDKAPDIAEYQKYYESIDPAHAAELYQQVIKQQQASEQIIAQANQFKSMKPEEAAPILETMSGDLDLVADILMNMKEKESGAILAKMDPVNAAKITKKMSGMN